MNKSFEASFFRFILQPSSFILFLPSLPGGPAETIRAAR
jgi:hypothetical protein